MMTQTISKFPLAAGQSILSVTKKASGWSFSQFMTAPLQNFGLGLLGFAMVFSASNALFWQTSAHPSPMFVTGSTSAMNVQSSQVAVLAPHPLELAVRRAGDRRAVAQGQAPVQAIVPAVVPTPSADNDKVTNENLAAAQTVLKNMGMFAGKVDGFYGPQTAQAIRAFETRFGLTPKGALTPQIINRINITQIGNLPAVVTPTTPAPTPAPTPVAATQVEVSPVNMPSEPPVQQARDNLSSITSTIAQASMTAPVAVAAVVAPVNPQVDKELILNIQTGLAKLGFYNKTLDGIAGESTAKAIREFENFLSFEMTGRISPQVRQWLVDAGAYL